MADSNDRNAGIWNTAYHPGRSSNEAKAEQDVKDMYAKQDREEYLAKVRSNPNTPVPKSMLDREYVKNPSGNYTHKAK